MNRILLTFCSLLLATWAQGAIRVSNLNIEGRTDQPLGLDVPSPRLGWQIVADEEEKNVRQTQYHIQVASSRALLEAGQPDLWDTIADSDQSQYITYRGKTLKANRRCFWRVQVAVSTDTGKKGNKSRTIQTDWSGISEWGVGLLNESHWKGYWIGLDEANPWDVEEEHSRLSARYYRTSFQTQKEVKRATLHIAGLGLYEAELNGTRIGQDVLTPAPTDYRKSIIYNSYDVTEQLNGNVNPDGRNGTHTILVTVSNGRYYTMQQNKKRYKITQFGYPTLRANLIIEYTDGKTETIATSDKNWQMTCDGAIRSANEYDGEIYDANKADLSDESLWIQAQRSAIPQGQLLGNVTPAMQIVDTLHVKQICKKADHSVILDFGQNFAGWIKTDLSKLSLQQGDTLRIRYAEKLDDAGNLYTENLRHAQSTDYYIASGKEQGEWAPRFVYHGGRYAEVSILRQHPSSRSAFRNPKADAFVGEVISDRMEKLYTFQTGNETLNQLVRNAYWGILSNYKGMPIDCPQRDERQPWLGDRGMGCWGESYLLDNHHLYNKWLQDIEESQRQDGCIPDVAPAFWNYYSDNVSWPSVFVFAAEMLYQQYGDNKAIIEHYPAMRKWLMHLYEDKRQSNGLIKADKYADWCVTPESAELIHSQDPSRVTDGILIGSCYMYKLLEVMSRFDSIMIEHLAQCDDATRLQMSKRGLNRDVLETDLKQYSEIRGQLRQAINKQFLTIKEGTSPAPDHLLYPDSVYYANNALTANLLPLAFGIVPQEYEETISRQVMAKIMLKPADGHLCCGVIGIQWLMRELSKRGRMDIAYLLGSNRTFPSWGYMIEHGATTIWELWNGDTANPKMNSGNHVMLLGDLLPWCFENIGSIRAAQPGFKEIRLAPNFELEELSSAAVSYQTPYGTVSSRWQKSLMHLSWDIEIPANTIAKVVTPNGEKSYGSGSWHIEEELPKKTDLNNRETGISNEFLFEKADFPSCHSASIAECSNGDLLVTYFGGSREGSPDVCIWTQRKRLLKRGKKGQPNTYEEGWSEPFLVADGTLLPQLDKGWREWPAADNHRTFREFTATQEVSSDTTRKACYNPVLYQIPDGDLLLFYKVGKDVRDWTGYLMRSQDNGYTWSHHRDSLQSASTEILAEMPNGSVERDSLLGAIKNQPILLPAGFRCKNGTILSKARILSPTSKETASSTKIKAGDWRSYVEISEDDGRTWALSSVIPKNKEIRCIQPTLLVHKDGQIQMLCRTATPKPGHKDRALVVTSFSQDGGLTWSEMQYIEQLPNNNSGIDAVTIYNTDSKAADNTFVLVYNPFGCADDRDKKDPAYNKPLRNPLCLAVSQDGIHWTQQMVLESSPVSQYSYPSIIVGSDGTLHCVYTWRRQRIKYQQIDAARLTGQE